MAVATAQDVADSLGRPFTSELEAIQIAVWLDDAEMQIRLRLGDVTQLDQQALRYVEREAVILKVRNPDGKQSEVIDDYQYRRYDAAARGQVWITEEWWDLLTPGGSAVAFSITPSGDAYWAAAGSTQTTLQPDWDSIG